MRKRSEPSVCALKVWKRLQELDQRAKESREVDWNFPENDCCEVERD